MRILKRLVLPFWAILLGSCAVRNYVPVVVLPIDPKLGGVTVCDRENNPVIILNQLHYVTFTAKYTEAHEFRHVDQIREFGNCKKFMRKYNEDKHFAMEIEAKAYCVSFNMQQADGLTDDGDYDEMVSRLMESFGFERKEVEKYATCKPSG